MTSWDIGIALIGFVSIALGLWRGLIRTVFGLLGWVAAIIAVPTLGPVAADSLGLTDYFWIAFVAAFLVVFIGIRLVGKMIARGARSAGLGGLDRLLGAALGGARALLIVAVMVVAAKYTGAHEGVAWKSSISRPLLEGVLAAVEPYLPEKLGGITRT